MRCEVAGDGMGIHKFIMYLPGTRCRDASKLNTKLSPVSEMHIQGSARVKFRFPPMAFKEIPERININQSEVSDAIIKAQAPKQVEKKQRFY